MHIDIRKLLMTINNCVLNYGRYIEAFKSAFISNYVLARLNMRDNSDTIELIGKEEMDADENSKTSEISNLGYLATFLQESTQIKSKDNSPNINTEIAVIEDKVKAECAKIYTGEFAKIINTPNKLPPCLVVFIQNLKAEMENFRLKCVRDLRTFVIIYLI